MARSPKELALTREMEAILEFLKKKGEATTKEITEQVKCLPKNRAVVENYLLRLFMQDEVYITRKGKAKVWRLNHLRIDSRIKPLVKAVLREYDENGKNVRNIWVDLFNSPKYGDYLYIQETRWVEGEGWVSKGGTVIPIHLVIDFVLNILKVAIKSEEFKKEHSEFLDQIIKFLKEVSPYIGIMELKG